MYLESEAHSKVWLREQSALIVDQLRDYYVQTIQRFSKWNGIISNNLFISNDNVDKRYATLPESYSSCALDPKLRENPL